MNNITADDSVYVIAQSAALISNDTVILELYPGTIWTHLKQDDVSIGIAFSGATRFIVDAITHTRSGAIGKSVKPELKGIQIYLGNKELEFISASASDSDLKDLGYENSDGFISDIEKRLNKWTSNESSVDVSEKTGDVFFGYDVNEKGIVLVSKDDKLVFTYDKQVTVLGDKKQVSVTEDGIAIGGKGGQTLTITKDGIDGLDDLIDIGSVVRTAAHGVRHGMKGLKALKKMKHRQTSHWLGPRYSGKYHGAYESVDDFDWAD